ncbi:DinB family protein [Amycolatopsis rifamycinica]|uniref:Mini-circle protein n=1 Tax=Amycolatopsis rifamycinica TaxID=287986 RepID=A0A066TWS4_9PSEU|nr:DinB family protein [Amycolatopsis rifamycinica]KDN19280.1 mini-circle protein [Amycolatopsis rifamycinica]
MTEKSTLLTFLRAQRESVLAILDGLDEQALTTAVLPSGWTPLGMVAHLGDAERHWFQEVVTGTAGPGEPASKSPEAVFAYYREQCRRSDEVFAATPLSARPRGRHPGPFGDQITDLRGVVLHVIEETARHAGHLDVVRELLDGRTGLGPR